MFEQVALADFLAENSTCTVIRAVASRIGPLVARGWQSQSETGNLNKACTSGAQEPFAEELTTSDILTCFKGVCFDLL
jgi:hypothetical protein